MKRTSLYDKHVEAGARMIDFGGWDMPVAYADISTEHAAVRNAVGLFDLCHMGRLRISGPDAEALVQGAQTNDLDRIKLGQIRYAMVLRDDGGVLDDILIHRRENDIFLVVNASNRERIVARLEELRGDRDATIDDQSESLGMIAIQGPKSPAVMARLTEDIDVAGLGYYRLAEGHVQGQPAMLTRTGYTGEDGFEIYIGAEHLPALWDASLEAGAAEGIIPCGLGARDTLRLEAGMPLYGHEIDEQINPVEADLMFGVRLKKPDYPGRDVLAKVKKEGPPRRLIGLAVEGRRIPRQGYAVHVNGEAAGVVASGSWSPTFDRGIATALVDTKALGDDAAFEVDIRGKKSAAKRVELPFYKRDGSGSLSQSQETVGGIDAPG